MTNVDPDRAEHEHNVNAAFGWIAAGTVLVVALLFFMLAGPADRSDRMATDDGRSATTGQNNIR